MAITKRGRLSKELARVGRYFHKRGWSLATSSNYSARLGDGKVLITTSGRDKRALRPAHFMVVDGHGAPVSRGKPSAETKLHCQLYAMFPAAHAVLHTHSPYGTILSMDGSSSITLKGYEMLKALGSIATHDSAEEVSIIANSQQMGQIAKDVEVAVAKNPHACAYLIAGHGMYTWADSIEAALRQVEALEFLLECEYHRRLI